jgi:putative ABC transport system ATP-binding protein
VTDHSPHGPPRDAAGLPPGGVDVHVNGVVHLYEHEGADIVALRGVDLDIGAGEMVALLGPSGMGKSTLLRLLAGLMRPSAGQIWVGETELSRLNGRELQQLRATEVSYVLQETAHNLLPFATAAQNVWFAQQGGRRLRRRPAPDPVALLQSLGLAGVAHRRVAELPRGEQQQVALAAGVSSSPRLLLADEPTNQLESAASAKVVALLQAINEQLGTTVVLVTHDPEVAGTFPRSVIIRDGRVGAVGRRGEQFAVVDGSGSLQLPPDVLEHFPPMTRFRVLRHQDGVDLRPVEGPDQ